uniref:Uncharacterized protein n=1 Tax=Cacopsylla melanoneura TaxID=428564 RepID=A0A8D8UBT1_9HEMI
MCMSLAFGSLNLQSHKVQWNVCSLPSSVLISFTNSCPTGNILSSTTISTSSELFSLAALLSVVFFVLLNAPDATKLILGAAVTLSGPAVPPAAVAAFAASAASALARRMAVAFGSGSGIGLPSFW